jgi:hypothetical protein
MLSRFPPRLASPLRRAPLRLRPFLVGFAVAALLQACAAASVVGTAASVATTAVGVGVTVAGAGVSVAGGAVKAIVP